MFSVRNLTKNFGSNFIFQHARLEIHPGEKIALVGANGMGKTTLLKILLGEEKNFEGNVEVPSSAAIQTVPQEFSTQGATLFEYVVSNFPQKTRLNRVRNLEKEIHLHPDDQKLLDQYAYELSIFEKAGGYDFIFEVKKVLEGMGFPESEFDRSLSTFSGGEKRRALLSYILIQKPDLLVLDEPTNHLDIRNTLFLENFLKNYSKTVLMVSHDREFINNVSSHICEIQNGEIQKYRGNYQSFQHQKQQKREEAEKELKKLKEEYDKIFDFVSRFKAGTRASQASSKEKKLDELKSRMKNCEFSIADYGIHFKEHSRPKAFDPPLKVKAISKSLGDRQLFSDVEFTIGTGERGVLLGVNGSGKTTLFNILTGKLEPDQGEVIWNRNVKTGYFTQETVDFASKENPYEFLVKNFGSDYLDQEIKAYLAGFRLDFYTPIEALSGGEKSKLKLLSLLLDDYNFLLLDEPTNHLDVYSIDGLKEIVRDFRGSIFFITHDRRFLREISPRVFILEENRVREEVQKDWDRIFSSFAMENGKQSPAALKTEAPKFSREERKKIRSLEREVKKYETRIEEMEIELEELKQLRFDEEYYLDYQKGQELENRINGFEKELEQKYREWERLQHEAESLSG